MARLLHILGWILIIVGVVQLLQGQLVFGLVLIALGVILGPSGYLVPRWRSRL